LYWWGKEAKGAGCEGHWRHCILEGFRPQVKEPWRDRTYGRDHHPSAVTHCYSFTSLTEKGDLLAGITVFTWEQMKWNLSFEPKRENDLDLFYLICFIWCLFCFVLFVFILFYLFCIYLVFFVLFYFFVLFCFCFILF